MRKNFSTILIVGAALLLASCVQQKESFSPVDYVNPLMGTESTYAFSHGNTYPAVAVPWGMNFWSPQTGENGSGWMYTYTDSLIRGFRQTHQPSPWINDYGTFSIMPLSGVLNLSHIPKRRRLPTVTALRLPTDSGQNFPLLHAERYSKSPFRRTLPSISLWMLTTVEVR